MFTITVNKKDLLEKIKANREEHRAVFDQAIEGYRKFVTQQLEEKIARLRNGKKIEHMFSFVVPEDHTADYDRVIGMLEMDLADEITLEETLYAQYVDNDWQWARNFAAASANYTVLTGTNYDKFTK